MTFFCRPFGSGESCWFSMYMCTPFVPIFHLEELNYRTFKSAGIGPRDISGWYLGLLLYWPEVLHILCSILASLGNVALTLRFAHYEPAPHVWLRLKWVPPLSKCCRSLAASKTAVVPQFDNVMAVLYHCGSRVQPALQEVAVHGAKPSHLAGSVSIDPFPRCR
jgi:hypothetical protein